MCKLLGFEGNHCKIMQTHSKSTGFGGFCGKQIPQNGAKCCLDSFSGRSRRGYLKFPSLGSPHGGEPVGLLPLFSSFALDAADRCEIDLA